MPRGSILRESAVTLPIETITNYGYAAIKLLTEKLSRGSWSAMVMIKSVVSSFGPDQRAGHRGRTMEVTMGCKATSYRHSMSGRDEVEFFFSSNPAMATSTDIDPVPS